jgi:thiamine-phosphate pyrophosphorylase
MQLTVITTDRLFDGESMIVNHLFEAGMLRLHLRKPSATEEELRNFLQQIKAEYYERIVLHDHFGLLQSFPLFGAHLNKRNRTVPADVEHLGCSCHSFGEVLQAIDKYDYLFLSPIFDSISKSGYNHAFTEEELITAKSEGLINSKVIALGGINEHTIPIAAKYGFGGVAVLGALWNRDIKDITKQFKILSTTVKNQRKDCYS